MNFVKYNINYSLVDKLKKFGINSPTEIQGLVIPKIKEKYNIIAESETGSGKTLSFLIPLIDGLIQNRHNEVLILAPTRELVLQISNEANKLCKDFNLNVLPIYGGKDIKSQINKLNHKIDIIVATPGRLIDHINRKTIDLSFIDVLVIDEADQMLLMGFKNEVDFIESKTDQNKLTLLFSATVNSKVKKMAYKYSDNFLYISAKGKNNIPGLIEQEFIFTTDRNKFDDLCRIINRDNPFMAIIFCRTKSRVDNLEMKLSQAGYNCDKIHSDISQAKRERIMKNFKDLKTQFLISTDLSSRGIDISGITHIYNYDFPERAEDYIHRIGRTGRIGKEGKSCSFITDKNQNIYEEIQNLLT